MERKKGESHFRVEKIYEQKKLHRTLGSISRYISNYFPKTIVVDQKREYEKKYSSQGIVCSGT